MIKLRKMLLKQILIISLLVTYAYSQSSLKYLKNKGYILDIDNLEKDTQLLHEIFKNKLNHKESSNNEFEIINRNIISYNKTVSYPNPENKATVIQLLKMSRNSYVPPTSSDWIDLTEFGWDSILPFGWDSNNEGKTSNRVRGHAFINNSEKIIVISIKGTSAGLFGIGGPTADKDKLNDNMMFSCCCASVDRTWKSLCDCNDKNIDHQCDISCIEKSSKTYKYSYLNQINKMKIYEKIKIMFKGYTITFNGHSLGGAIASLLAMQYELSAITFESPGEALFASRLGIIPEKEDYQDLPIYHFGNNADPIFLGKCNGISSTCYHSGFAMETKCHVGNIYLFIINEENDPGNGNDEPPSEKTLESENIIPPKKSALNGNQLYINLENYDKSENERIDQNDDLINNEYDDENDDERINEIEINEENKKEKRFSLNPIKLSMLRHRIDYVLKLVQTWEEEWPSMDNQADCKDCEDWQFIRPIQHEPPTPTQQQQQQQQQLQYQSSP